jgi:hypothetical protein
LLFDEADFVVVVPEELSSLELSSLASSLLLEPEEPPDVPELPPLSLSLSAPDDPPDPPPLLLPPPPSPPLSPPPLLPPLPESPSPEACAWLMFITAGAT